MLPSKGTPGGCGIGADISGSTIVKYERRNEDLLLNSILHPSNFNVLQTTLLSPSSSELTYIFKLAIGMICIRTCDSDVFMHLGHAKT